MPSCAVSGRQFRVQPLRKQLERLCVFWTNTEIDLPGGSVAEQAKVAGIYHTMRGEDRP